MGATTNRMGVTLSYACFLIAARLGSLLTTVDARSSGAPVDTYPGICGTMMPGHFTYQPQASASPYTIELSGTTYTPGESITVTTTASGNLRYKGIFLQMRRADTDAIVGSWSVSDSNNFQVATCSDSNAVTHTNGNRKAAVNTFTWTAPATAGTDIYVVASYVDGYTTFWVQERSSTITAL